MLLSQNALSDRIYEKDDILRKEIAYAYKKKKQIVGIMLSGFEAFTKDLPGNISDLPYINCLNGRMEYYDAMFDRLTSGQFLQSIPRRNVGSETKQVNEIQRKEETLEWFKSFDLEKNSST